MTTDPNTLTEQIAHDLFLHDMRAQGLTADWAEGAWDDMGGSERSEERVDYEMRAAAVLPLVRAAQADALRGWALGVESELNASRAHGINLGEWERGLRSGVRQALHVADQIERENTDG